MEQGETLWDKGVFISYRDAADGVYRLVLYQVDSFYVEAWYHKEHNSLHRFRTFKNVALLDPYMENMDIDIAGLLSNKPLARPGNKSISKSSGLIANYRVLFKVSPSISDSAIIFRLSIFIVLVFIIGLIIGLKFI